MPLKHFFRATGKIIQAEKWISRTVWTITVQYPYQMVWFEVLAFVVIPSFLLMGLAVDVHNIRLRFMTLHFGLRLWTLPNHAVASNWPFQWPESTVAASKWLIGTPEVALQPHEKKPLPTASTKFVRYTAGSVFTVQPSPKYAPLYPNPCFYRVSSNRNLWPEDYSCTWCALLSQNDAVGKMQMQPKNVTFFVKISIFITLPMRRQVHVQPNSGISVLFSTGLVRVSSPIAQIWILLTILQISWNRWNFRVFPNFFWRV